VFGGEVAGKVALGCAAVGVEAQGDVCEGGEDVTCCEDDGEERGYGGEHGHGRERAKKTSWTATGADIGASKRYQYSPVPIDDWG
jgi:hypothetical protein